MPHSLLATASKSKRLQANSGFPRGSARNNPWLHEDQPA
jgi:hypothetical protein